MNIAFDTLSISKKLRGAGLTEDQANAAGMPDISHLATKDDVTVLRNATKDDLTNGLTSLRNELSADIKTMGYDLLKWTFTIILSASFINVGATVGLIKLLNLAPAPIEKPVEAGKAQR